MKNANDEVCDFAYPHILSAVYFGVLAVIATLIVDSLLYFSGVEIIIPIGKAVFFAGIVAAVFGFLFGKLIVHSQPPYKKRVFFLGFLLVLLALPFYDMIFLYLIKDYRGQSNLVPDFDHLLVVYLFILAYSFIMIGLWLAILGGIAALFLREHFIFALLHCCQHHHNLCLKKKIAEPSEGRHNSGEHLPH